MYLWIKLQPGPPFYRLYLFNGHVKFKILGEKRILAQNEGRQCKLPITTLSPFDSICLNLVQAGRWSVKGNNVKYFKPLIFHTS